MLSESFDFDVIICGGGPGGSTCALGFVDTNIKVAVIEKSGFPREKVCGDGVAAYVPKALNKISPKFGEAFKNFENKISISHASFYSFNNAKCRLKIPEDWYISSRYDFDNFLFETAKSLPNVSYFLEEQIQSIKIEDEKSIVTTENGKTFTAKLIIGADGATSIVRRSLTNYKMDPVHHCAAIRAYYEGVKDVDGHTYEFYFVPKYPNGYFWIFPSTDDKVNIGFGMMSDEVATRKIKLRETLEEIINDSPILKRRFEGAKIVGDIKGWSIPMGYGTHDISGNRFMLIGDAASIADPATGEGIGQAVVSGRIAAEVAVKCFHENDFSAKKLLEYNQQIHQKFGRINLKRYKISRFILKNKWMLNAIITLLNSNRIISKLTFKTAIKITS